MSHPLTILAVAVLVLVLLDLASLRWGADSRRTTRPSEPPESGDIARSEWW